VWGTLNIEKDDGLKGYQQIIKNGRQKTRPSSGNIREERKKITFKGASKQIKRFVWSHGGGLGVNSTRKKRTFEKIKKEKKENVGKIITKKHVDKKTTWGKCEGRGNAFP